jgi:peptidylprolyl isomerase
MRKNILIVPLAAFLALSPLSAQEAEKKEYPSPNAIVDAAPASDWQPIAASDLLVMDLAPDAKGEARRVIIQLMPPPFSQGWIGNIRKLAAAKFWDGTSINRVQDNYVVQWGDAGYDNPESGETEQKALPEGLVEVPESEYSTNVRKQLELYHGDQSKIDPPARKPLPWKTDAYSLSIFLDGWPIASHGSVGWPIHCYAAVGVGRNLSPDTGTGAELYTVIGHAPRHLDRNIAVVGRIIEGIEHLSSLPRGKGQLGFYADPKKRVPIQSIRLGTALPATDQPRFEYLDTASKAFAKYADARANRRDPFFIKPAGGADICNIPVPVRRVKAED